MKFLDSLRGKRHVAHKLIDELISECNVTNVRKQFWMDKVFAYTKYIFGKHSDNIALPMFETYYNSVDERFARPVHAITDENAETLVNIMKEMFGVYKEMINRKVFEKTNIFSDFNNWTIIGIVAAITIPIIAGLVSWAFNEGQRVENVRQMQLKCEIISLRQELEIFEKNNAKNYPNYNNKEYCPREQNPIDSAEIRGKYKTEKQAEMK